MTSDDEAQEVLKDIINTDLDEDIIEALKGIVDYNNELDKESDRGAAILAAAHFDNWLGELISEQFVELSKKVHKRIFEGSLFSFSAKIDMAFALGLYDSNILKGLRTVNQIRNKFAHIDEPMAFSDKPLSDMCRELDIETIEDSDDPRRRYLEYLNEVENRILQDLTTGNSERRRRGDDS